MELVSQNGTYIENPTRADIEDMLQGLGWEGNRCAALLRSDTELLEARWCGEMRFSLQIDGPEGGAETTKEDISLDTVVAAFYAYSRCETRWKTQFEWRETSDAAHRAAMGTQTRWHSWRK